MVRATVLAYSDETAANSEFRLIIDRYLYGFLNRAQHILADAVYLGIGLWKVKKEG